MDAKDKCLNMTLQDKIKATILENYNKYYRLAYSYVHNEYDAADIVQNGAIQAIQNCGTLHEEKYAATWIYRIMINEIFKCYKKNHEIPMDLTQEEFTEQQEDSYENFDLKDAIDKLDPKDKMIIELKFYEDYSLQEIADLLEENISTIKSRLYRNLKKLRLELE